MDFISDTQYLYVVGQQNANTCRIAETMNCFQSANMFLSGYRIFLCHLCLRSTAAEVSQ